MSDDRTKTIKKLNVLQKLLSQDLVSIRRGIGDDEVIQEVNAEVKKFLTARLDFLLGKTASPESVFSPEVVVVLQEVAQRILQKSSVGAAPPPTDPPVTPVDGDSGSHDITPRRPVSPVMEALRQHGFDPNATVEERKRAIKLAETKRREEK